MLIKGKKVKRNIRNITWLFEFEDVVKSTKLSVQNDFELGEIQRLEQYIADNKKSMCLYT